MTNYQLIENAAEVAQNRLQQEDIYMNYNNLYNNAASWYNHNNTMDVQTLAAVAITGSFDVNVDPVIVRDFFFSEN